MQKRCSAGHCGLVVGIRLHSPSHDILLEIVRRSCNYMFPQITTKALVVVVAIVITINFLNILLTHGICVSILNVDASCDRLNEKTLDFWLSTSERSEDRFKISKHFRAVRQNEVRDASV
uniref:Uncharacterized protein n=1 Tax=Glossina pallidipes TaxID=7398 RepID=A0A1A9Z308_GLOPL